MKVDLPLMKIALTPSAKSVLIPLGLILATSAADSAIQNKIHSSGTYGLRRLIISNEEHIITL